MTKTKSSGRRRILLGPLDICLRVRCALGIEKRSLTFLPWTLMFLPNDKKSNDGCYACNCNAQKGEKDDSKNSPTRIFSDGGIERWKIQRSAEIGRWNADRIIDRTQ